MSTLYNRLRPHNDSLPKEYNVKAPRVTLDQWRTLQAVVDHGGFAAAERATGIPKSKLSRRVAELESALSVRLIQRTTRRWRSGSPPAASSPE